MRFSALSQQQGRLLIEAIDRSLGTSEENNTSPEWQIFISLEYLCIRRYN
jgi:hypothetical protein